MANEAGAEVIRFRCVQCSASLTVPASQAGSFVKCAGCENSMQVPLESLPGAPMAIERPAPAVVSRMESVAASTGPTAAAPMEAHVPLAPAAPVNAPRDEAADARVLAVAASEVADPTAGPSRSPAGHPLPQVPTIRVESAATAPRAPSRDKRYQKQAGPPRTMVLGICVAIVAVIGSGVGVSVYRDSQRAHLQSEVEDQLVRAQTAFSANDVAGAAKIAQDADQQISASPLALDPQLVEKWRTQIKRFNEMQQDVDNLQKQAVNADKDPAGVRSLLEGKRLLLGPANDSNRPLVNKIELLLADVSKLEEKRKVEKLRGELGVADDAYKQGKIEEAADKALQIGKEMAAKPRVQDRDLESRLEILRKRAETLKTAKDLLLSASKNYADAKSRIQGQLNALDEKNDDLQPLVQRLTQLKKDLTDEEKRSRKLSAEDAGYLRRIAGSLAAMDRRIVTKALEGDTLGMEFDGKPLRLGIQRTALSITPFVEVAGNRFLLDPAAFGGKSPRPVRALRHALALGDAMKNAGVSTEEFWTTADEAPLVSGRRIADDGREYIFLGDRLYSGKPLPKTQTEKETEADFAKQAEALEQAVKNDPATPAEVRSIVAESVHATFKEADWYDHLPGEFVRKVVNGSYIEDNMPGSAERLKKELANYRAAYSRISSPAPTFSGSSAAGDQATEMRTFEDHAVWLIYDKASDTTTFAIKNPDEEKECLFILYDYPGKLSEFPENATPKRVRMTHQAVGVIATYDPAAQAMTSNKEAWDLAAALELPPWRPDFVAMQGFGTPGWALPPHVLLVDQHGNTRSIVTPFGRLDMQDFSKIAQPAERQKAMDAFIDQMAKVMPTGNYLHLYFRYFHEYILDSPITAQPNLLGSRSHGGDIHQTVYESLTRLFGGRYIGDCDDLAETFMTVTRRQGKLSYVMALPAHAACGWTEKGPAGDYTFYVIDTGPPRIFTNKNLDKVVELASRAYDQDKTMRFDPKSLGFLFRFNGEPTRTPYWLSSRMYVDKDYGEVMERVQGYWHFHFYALGVKTMSEMIQKGDRVPENCIELAGLYGMVREVDDSIKWTQEALKQFGPEDRLSRYNEEFRIGMLWRDEHNDQKAYDAVKGMIGELKALESDPQSMNYISSRMQLMGLLEAVDRPWEAWGVVARDMELFARMGQMRIEHAAGLTNVYQKMQKLIKAGKEMNASERSAMKTLEAILTWFYDRAVFAEPDDDFNAYQRKYAFLGDWYAGKYSHERLVEELLKDGPFPDPVKPRNHRQRKDPEEEDWKWIRLSVPSYAMAMGDAIDLTEPPEKWRKDEVVKLVDAMVRAAEHARQFGSLASAEFEILSARVTRAFIKKDWADFEKVLQETQRRNWARLTSDIAETVGRCARFVTPQEFQQQYRLFTKYITTRPSYFTVVYEAYRAEGIEHALAAAKVALELLPGDEDMSREAKYLDQLAKKKLAAIAKKDADQKKAPAPPVKP